MVTPTSTTSTSPNEYQIVTNVPAGCCATITQLSTEEKVAILQSDMIWVRERIEYLTAKIKSCEDTIVLLEKKLAIAEARVEYFETLDKINV